MSKERGIVLGELEMKVRKFEGGATRDITEGKLAYNRFLSPEVLTVYCQYLEKHRDTAAGRRDQDNWKAGIPTSVYMESMSRHFWDVWTQDETGHDIDIDALCALLFNVQGLLHNRIKQRFSKDLQDNPPCVGAESESRKGECYGRDR